MEVSPCHFGNAPWAGTQGFGMLDEIGAWGFGGFLLWVGAWGFGNVPQR